MWGAHGSCGSVGPTQWSASQIIVSQPWVSQPVAPGRGQWFRSRGPHVERQSETIEQKILPMASTKSSRNHFGSRAPFTHMFVNLLPGIRFSIRFGCYRQWATSSMGGKCEIQRPGTEVQVNLRGVQVGFGWGRRIDSQRFGNGAQNMRPFRRRPQPFERTRHLTGPFLPLGPIFAPRHESSWKITEKGKGRGNGNPAEHHNNKG